MRDQVQQWLSACIVAGHDTPDGDNSHVSFEVNAPTLEALCRRWLAVEELRAVWDAMPAGLLYLDPPDGGDVPLAEQVRRMGEDAARYDWIRRKDTPALHALQWANGAVLDHAVDVARGAMPDAAIAAGRTE